MKLNFVDKLVRLMAIILATTPIISCDYSEKLNTYTCSSGDAAKTCGKGCSFDREMKFSFLTNLQDKSVFQIRYWEGEKFSATTHKNCIIFNSKNWDCSKHDAELPNIIIDRTNMMANGIYTDLTEIYNKNNYTLKNPEQKSLCAKPN